jgi:translation initiation factor IF-3
MAIEANLDLVEIQPKLVPPVAKIMNYGKFQFSINKKKSSTKKKQKEIKLKEVKFRPNTGTNDYLIKLKNIKIFLFNGNKIKITVCFKGREIIHKNSGIDLMKKICIDLHDFCKIDLEPKFEGKNIITVISPVKK